MYRVLIVDDDKAVRYMLKRYKGWDNYGFVLADEACDGKDALKKLNSSHFDIVISDIKMPGMDGIEFLNELRNSGSDICVLFLSTHSDFSYAKQGIRLGVFDYLTKPLNDELLSEALKRSRDHLDEKIKQKASRSIETILDTNQAYYTKTEGKKVVSDILAGSLEAINKVITIFDRISVLTDGDLGKLTILVENILLEIDESIFDVFPWIRNLESQFSSEFSKENDNSLLKQKSIDHISNLVRLIVKYELHQSDSLIRKTCEYVINNIEQDIKIETIANELYVSKDYIGKVFKQKVGYHLSEYIIKAKMEHAKYLISKGGFKNYEISEKLGYKKPDYFAQLFKTHTGYTPSEFKKLSN